MIITIDGPTGSGKSTIARLLAEKLGFYYINTGLLYRALAYILMQQKNYTYEMLAAPNTEEVSAIADTSRLAYTYHASPLIIFDNNDITAHLKDAVIDKGASIISAVGSVRELLLGFQRNLAQQHNVVAEGRDTGTVVFPYAEYKFYLTADSAVRAQRWLDIQKLRGTTLTLQEAISFIKERDMRDSQRDVAPLSVAPGARIIDNSCMSQAETLQTFLALIHI